MMSDSRYAALCGLPAFWRGHAWLRLLLAAQRGILTWQQAADQIGISRDQAERLALREAVKAAMGVTT